MNPSSGVVLADNRQDRSRSPLNPDYYSRRYAYDIESNQEPPTRTAFSESTPLLPRLRHNSIQCMYGLRQRIMYLLEMAKEMPGLVSWLLLTMLIFLLILQLDAIIDWNWFLIFTPLWIYDIILVNIIKPLRIVKFCRRRKSWMRMTPAEKYPLYIVLNITFHLLLWVKLEFKGLHLPMYIILLPVWIFLPLLIFDMLMILSLTKAPKPPSKSAI